MSIIWHNGDLKEDGPVFSVHDRLRLGEGVFDTMPCTDGKPHHISEHFEKLLHAGDVFFGQWDKPNIDTLKQAAQALLERNGYTTGFYALRTMITSGPGYSGIRLPKESNLQITMCANKVPDSWPVIKAVIAQSVRRNEGSPLSQIKCTCYGESILALREAEEHGANEAILLNNEGHVTCATTSNIFIERDGKLITPSLSDGAQAGLTRRFVIEQYQAIEKPLTPEDLRTADSIYITNSIRGAAKVEYLNGQPCPQGNMINKDIHLS